MRRALHRCDQQNGGSDRIRGFGWEVAQRSRLIRLDTSVARTEGYTYTVRGFGWEVAQRSRLIPLDTSVARTEGYTYATKVWALCVVVQGAFFFCRPVPSPNGYDSKLSPRCTLHPPA